MFNLYVLILCGKKIHDCHLRAVIWAQKEKLKLYVYQKFKRIANTKLRQQDGSLNLIRVLRGGGIFHQARGFLPITLDVIKVHS